MINKVLFIMEKHCDADPNFGPTLGEHLIVNAVRSTSLVRDAKKFYLDVLSKQMGQEQMSKLLLEDCELYRPDLIIYTPLGGALGDYLNPTPETMLKIKGELRIKTYLHLYDGSPNCGLEVKWLPLVDILGTNSIETYLYYKKDYPQVIMGNAPVSQQDYYRTNCIRDIDVSHMGSIHSNRRESLLFLRNNGVNLYTGGGQRQNRCSVEEFSDILRRSKISLNFCRDTGGLTVIKHRVFEIASCGACLFEERGTDTVRLLEPGKDMVVFDNKEELLDLVRHYLEHDDEREAIAQSGHEKATSLYNATNAWGYIFEKMGFNLPESLAGDGKYQLYKEKVENL